MKIFIPILAILTCCNPLFGQKSDSIVSPLTVWGFVDFYYAYDFSNPASHNRPGFIYSHNRHNEFALNNAVVGLKYSTEKVRGGFAFHTGTYVRSNYAAEPDLLRMIYEAYAGYRIAKNLWLDAGIFPSHIGTESALSIDNLTLSRSMMAENTPYYESGVRLIYIASEKWMFSGLVLNGWQNITENNDNKAVGAQIQFKPINNVIINSSTYLGKEKPGYDSLHSRRYFHNFYLLVDLKKVSVIAALDIGLQKKRIGTGSNVWYNPNLIVRFRPSEKIAFAARVEYYDDQTGVMINLGDDKGFQTLSPSLNFDYRFDSNIVWRIEGRLFRSKDKIFLEDVTLKNNNAFVLSSLAFKF
ncbi:MAG TPA: porin [Cytophagaceae bacterium]